MKKLHSLDVNEISLVPRGANRKKFLVFKSDEGNRMNIQEEVRRLINGVPAETMKRVETVVKSFGEAKVKEGEEPTIEKDGEGDEAGGMSERAMAALKACARILEPFKDEINDGHMDAIQNEIGMKDPGAAPALDAPADKAAGCEGMEKSIGISAPDGVEEEHHNAALGEAQKAYSSSLEKMGYEKSPADGDVEKAKAEKAKADKIKSEKSKKDDEEEEEDMEKSKVGKSDIDFSVFPKEQRGQIEAIFKSGQETRKENEVLKEEIRKRDEREKEREYITKADTFTHLGLPKDEVVEALRDAAKAGQKTYDRTVKHFEMISKQSRESGLYSELGSSQGHGGVSDADAKLNALVEQVVQKSDGTKSRSQIYDEVSQTKEGKLLFKQAMDAAEGGR